MMQQRIDDDMETEVQTNYIHSQNFSFVATITIDENSGTSTTIPI